MANSNLPRRIIKETQRLLSEPAPGISASPSEENMRYFNVMILGPSQSPYEGGVFKLELFLPEEYPMAAPKFSLASRLSQFSFVAVPIADAGPFPCGGCSASLGVCFVSCAGLRFPPLAVISRGCLFPVFCVAFSVLFRSKCMLFLCDLNVSKVAV
ncbi:hypothetical protein M5K25_024519 [Dendrobium thyrsiflorum]|uniref:UBC core domain-containing protein n=1 Tax=Dendrobium thyrsiflorum TaxID=117978 RepID=A0ABD0U2D1_DENTH